MTTFRQILSVLLWIAAGYLTIKSAFALWICYVMVAQGGAPTFSTNWFIGFTGGLVIVSIIVGLSAALTWKDAE
jgi:hypothetical protein